MMQRASAAPVQVTVTQPAIAAQGWGQGGAPQIQVPRNQEELSALMQLRGEFREQLSSITRLRQELTNQIAQAAAVNDDQSVRQLQARVRNLESRSADLEQQILRADEAISTGIARGITVGTPDVHVSVPPMTFPPMEFGGGGIDEDAFVATILGMTLLFTFLGIIIHRRAWRRAEKKFSAVASGDRGDIQQLQQAVDVIAVEVERIAEGQRYVSKLLNDRLQGSGDDRLLVPANRSPGAGH